MTKAVWQEGQDISLFGVAAMLLRNRWRIIGGALVGGAIAFALVAGRPALYEASASFVPLGGNDAGRSGLASLAGQFGVPIAAGSPALSPDFYAQLLESRELLGAIARDTLVVPEEGGRRLPVVDLLEIDPGPAKLRYELAVQELDERISASVSKLTGIVSLRVATPWPSVSLGITTRLVEDVNAFNQRTRREQAEAERRFLERRLALAEADLRRSEDRLEQFLQGNRQFSSPELTFTRERLQRAVSINQQVHTSLTQSFEEVRMREVRDTPVISVIESPYVPARPAPRGRLIRLLIGIMFGAGVGVVLALVKESVAQRRRQGDPALNEFHAVVSEVRQGIPFGARRPRGSAIVP